MPIYFWAQKVSGAHLALFGRINAAAFWTGKSRQGHLLGLEVGEVEEGVGFAGVNAHEAGIPSVGELWRLIVAVA